MQTTIDLDWSVVPAGFIPVAWREPKEGDWVATDGAAVKYDPLYTWNGRCLILRQVVEDGWRLLREDDVICSQDACSTDAITWVAVSGTRVGQTAGRVAGARGRQLGRNFFIRRRRNPEWSVEEVKAALKLLVEWVESHGRATKGEQE